MTSNMANDAVFALCSELKAYLALRSDELNNEIRNYPTPIARCDEQLTKLIEQRTRAAHQLKLVTELSRVPSGCAGNVAHEHLRAFLMGPEAIGGDDVEMAIVSRLRAALSGPRQTD